MYALALTAAFLESSRQWIDVSFWEYLLALHLVKGKTMLLVLIKTFL